MYLIGASAVQSLLALCSGVLWNVNMSVPESVTATQLRRLCSNTMCG